MTETNSLRQILSTQPRKTWSETAPDDASLGDEIIQSVQYGRVGLKPQLMIAFVKLDGYVEALQYITLRRIRSHSWQSITLDFLDQSVLIEGVNLERLFRYLQQNRVVEIAEVAKHAVMQAPADETLVYRLEIKRASSSAKREEKAD